MTPDPISADLKAVLRRLKLSRGLDTLPDRLILARQQKLPHQDFLLLVFSDEVTRRDGLAATVRAQRAGLDPGAQLEHWDPTAKVTFDRALLNELTTLRFLESYHHVTIVGPVGVGKTFLAHALGHIACRRGHSVLAVRADRMLKTLKHARLTQSHEAELRKLLTIDLLLIDDFGLDTMDAQESRDAYDTFLERHRAGSMVVVSNRGPDEWLATFADPAPCPERHRSLHQQRLRPRDRGRVLPHPAQAQPEGDGAATEGIECPRLSPPTPPPKITPESGTQIWARPKLGLYEARRPCPMTVAPALAEKRPCVALRSGRTTVPQPACRPSSAPGHVRDQAPGVPCF